MAEPFDPTDLYLDLRDGGALERLPAGEPFWADLMAGKIDIQGRLVSAYRFTTDWDTWERHPAGEELLCLLDGAAEVRFEDAGGVEQIVHLNGSKRCFLVPRGAWHRFVVPDFAYVLFVTPGEGTEHRPL